MDSPIDTDQVYTRRNLSPHTIARRNLARDIHDLLLGSAMMPSRQRSQHGPGVLRVDGPDGAALRAIALAWCEEVAASPDPPQGVLGLRMALEDMSACDVAGWVRGLQTLRRRALP